VISEDGAYRLSTGLWLPINCTDQLDRIGPLLIRLHLIAVPLRLVAATNRFSHLDEFVVAPIDNRAQRLGNKSLDLLKRDLSEVLLVLAN
jgi:hypothetical protein